MSVEYVSNAFMDARDPVVVVGTANNCKQLLQPHTIDIVKHRCHFVVWDFATDTLDELDIVRLDIVIAMKAHMIGLRMDLASDNCQMLMRKLLAVGAHSTAVDMDVVLLLAMFASVALSTDREIDFEPLTAK